MPYWHVPTDGRNSTNILAGELVTYFCQISNSVGTLENLELIHRTIASTYQYVFCVFHCCCFLFFLMEGNLQKPSTHGN